MNSKLLYAFLILTISSTLCQEGWYPWEGNEAPKPGDGINEPCDSPVCVGPCPEAAPPRYCPANMTRCASGCVCMLECRSPVYVCFQTKFCVSRRRYLKRPTTHPYYYASVPDNLDE